MQRRFSFLPKRSCFYCFIPLLLLFKLAGTLLRADPPLWDFTVQHAGRVLYEGGWYQEYNLGTINASPEFNFPLELIYLNTREASGMFGTQWFCPQLETTVIPQGVRQFNWQMPSGRIEPFRPDPVYRSRFRDASGQWLASLSSDRCEIWNQDGWTFNYDHAQLQSLKSPTGRILQFVWAGDALQGVQLSDPVSGQQRTLLQIVSTGTDHKIIDMVYDGIEQKFAYQNDIYGKLLSWTPPDKNQVYFAYSSQGVLEQVQPAQPGNGDLVTFSTTLVDINLSGRNRNDPAKWWLVEDPDNKYTYVGQDKKNAVLVPGKFSVMGKNGSTQSVDFDPRTATLTETMDGLVRTTTYYQAPGRSYSGMPKTIEENGVLKSEADYDPSTEVLSAITDANGIITNYDYPPKWVRTELNPWPPKPIRIWRGSVKAPQVLAQFQYDPAGRVVISQDAAGQNTAYKYTPRGELGSLTAPDGITSSLGYDSFGRCVQAQVGDQLESVVYDNLGHVISHTSPDGTKTEYTYDEEGNLTAVSRNGKPAMNYLRDDKGKIIGEKDSLGRLRKIDSDSHGNVLADYAPDGAVTKYEYDKFNRRTAQIDGNGNRVSFTLDPGDHIIKQVNALGSTINWTYNSEGLLIAKDNGVQKITYSYDGNNRLVTTDYGTPDQKINYTYDDHGRMTSMVTPATAFYYIYDQLGRTDAVRAVSGQDEQILRFRYNYEGQRTGLILAQYVPPVVPANGKIGYGARYQILQQTEYTYDNRRLSSIVSNGTPVVTYRYDSGGRPVQKTYGNGIQATLSYDTMGHLGGIVFAGGPLPTPLTLAYVWDSADQVTQRTWNGETLRYEYDADGRLAKVTHVIDAKTSEVVEAYAYDKAGNITQKTLQGQKTVLAYNAANELVSTTGPSGAASYDYDAAGRLLSYTGGPSNTYGWLDKVIQTGSAGQGESLTYWPDGQLAAKGPVSSVSKVSYVSGSGDTEHFLWDGLGLLRRDDVIYVVEPYASGGVPIASHPIEASETTYYLNDLLGTTLAWVRNSETEFNNLTSFGQMSRSISSLSLPAMIQVPASSVPSSTPQQLVPPSIH